MRAPDDFSSRMNLARSLQESLPPRYELAARHYTAAIALQPTSVEAPHELVILLAQKMERGAEALAVLEPALERWPDETHLRFHLGILLSQAGDEQSILRAIEQLRIAEVANPLYSPTQHNLGQCMSNLGRDEEALAFYDAAIELDPSIAVHHHSRANTLSTLKL